MSADAKKIFVVFVTTGSQEEASMIAKHIVEERLAACVNIIPTVRSIYKWEGEVCDDEEALMIIKTSRPVFPRLRDKIKELHSYEVPEIIAFNLSDGFEGYLSWVLDTVSR